jgi:hypothetical protein
MGAAFSMNILEKKGVDSGKINRDLFKLRGYSEVGFWIIK